MTDVKTGDHSASEIACPVRRYKTMLALFVGKEAGEGCEALLRPGREMLQIMIYHNRVYGVARWVLYSFCNNVASRREVRWLVVSSLPSPIERLLLLHDLG